MGLQVFVRCVARTPGTESGDAFHYSEEGEALWMAVADGLGSGPEAAHASRLAIDCIRHAIDRWKRDTAPRLPPGLIESVVEECDQALRHTRGAALTLTVLDLAQHCGTSVGVGNVGLRIVGFRPVRPTGVAGIVGVGIRKLRSETFEYVPGDLIVMHSDGLSSHFTIDPMHARSWSLDVVGERLVQEYRHTHDDMALLLLRHDA